MKGKQSSPYYNKGGELTGETEAMPNLTGMNRRFGIIFLVLAVAIVNPTASDSEKFNDGNRSPMKSATTPNEAAVVGSKNYGDSISVTPLPTRLDGSTSLHDVDSSFTAEIRDGDGESSRNVPETATSFAGPTYAAGSRLSTASTPTAHTTPRITSEAERAGVSSTSTGFARSDVNSGLFSTVFRGFSVRSTEPLSALQTTPGLSTGGERSKDSAYVPENLLSSEQTTVATAYSSQSLPSSTVARTSWQDTYSISRRSMTRSSKGVGAISSYGDHEGTRRSFGTVFPMISTGGLSAVSVTDRTGSTSSLSREATLPTAVSSTVVSSTSSSSEKLKAPLLVFELFIYSTATGMCLLN